MSASTTALQSPNDPPLARSSSTRETLDHMAALKLPRVAQQHSVRALVADALRVALMSGEMRSGSIYSAPALGAQLGVSPTPVREAMLDLTKEGLVEVVRNKGFRVVDLSESELADLAELRCLLEVPTIGKIARSASTVDLERLKPLVQQIVDAAQVRDVITFVHLDRQFHLELLALGGNRFLVESVGELRNRERLALLRDWASADELARNAHEHTQLLDLLVAGDAERAETLIRSHIGRLRRRDPHLDGDAPSAHFPA